MCKCVLYFCHRVTNQLQLTNISYYQHKECHCHCRYLPHPPTNRHFCEICDSSVGTMKTTFMSDVTPCGRRVTKNCHLHHGWWLFEDAMSGLFLSFNACFWKIWTKGKIDVAIRRGKWRKQLLDDLKEKRGYWELKEERLERTLWRTRFGRGYGPVVRYATQYLRCLFKTIIYLESLILKMVVLWSSKRLELSTQTQC